MNSTMPLAPTTSSDRIGAVWAMLESLTDPEIPVLSLREMGILREVREVRDGPVGAAASDQPAVIEVVITPTYSGCPAMDQIEDDVRRRLAESGIAARLLVQWAPAWTTDWMSPSAHARLREYGIAPPSGYAPVALARGGSARGPTGEDVRRGAAGMPIAIARQAARNLTEPGVPCPRCGSQDTTETSHFGSTACKALFRCLACMEPFDHFKPH
jgi:ring-1,2-phenylacetyl-CoA epoxidase subunit PaaD